MKPGWLVLGGVALALALGVGGRLALRRLDFFRVRRIELVGVTYLSPAAVTAALKLGPRASVFDDLGPAERGVAALPGIAQATIRRRIPGTLRVEVTEVQPVALVPQDDGLRPIDARGRLLPYDPTRVPPDLPVARAADSAVAGVLERLREVDPTTFAQIQDARRAGEDVVLQLDGRRFRLGAGAPAEALRALIAVAADLGRKGRAWRELDGRFAGQVIVRRRDA